MADVSHATTASFPYQEPNISTLLILASFLILLNNLNSLLNSTIYCGLIAQLFVGIAYGTPGAKWLSPNTEATISGLGYIGLVLIVYEGGLSTSLTALRANIGLASGVAVTGITTPITLSFVLKALIGATDLQAFAAGAALCSTSLGTTFAVLQSTGLDNSRLGVVLTTAAMMDDVIGLVMVEVIDTLGGNEAFGVATVLRPIGVSVAFVVVVPLACWMVDRLGWVRWGLSVEAKKDRVWRLLERADVVVVIHCLFLLAMVSAGSYAGTSNLFTAYLAGVIVNWWDNSRANIRTELWSDLRDNAKDKGTCETHTKDESKASSSRPTNTKVNTSTPRTSQPSITSSHSSSDVGLHTTKLEQSTHCPVVNTGLSTYHQYLSQPVNRLLKPFFFASIGFSIPISQMFNGGVLWRGIVYTVLMLAAKLVCGIWLLRFKVPGIAILKRPGNTSDSASERAETRAKPKANENDRNKKHTSKANIDNHTEPAIELSRNKPSEAQQQQQQQGTQQSSRDSAPATTTIPPPPPPDPPLSLYPSLILGSAMVARGEIGFLISALAESRGIFTTPVDATSIRDKSKDIFLVVTWAIMLCTIIGPVSVGLFVRRVRRLEKGKGEDGRGKDVLGVWGVD